MASTKTTRACVDSRSVGEPLNRLVAAASLAFAAATAALGCGGKDSFDGRVFHAGRMSFHTGPIPSTWERVSIDGPLVAFHDRTTNGAVDVYAQCGKDADDVPLVALRHHLLIGFTERAVKREETIPFDGREALHTVLEAKLDGVPVSLDLYVLKKDGCVYDLVYVAPPSKFGNGVQGFEAFAAGFGTLG